MTILEVLKKTTQYFEQKGIESPKVNAECLLAHALGCPRLELYLSHASTVEDFVLERLRLWVKRRAAREPLQYIVGKAPFINWNLTVGPGVLIPRPETEELIELIQKIISARRVPKRILDLGTGSGAIAIALNHFFPDAQVVAVDNSSDALLIAQKNSKLYPSKNAITFMKSDWFSELSGLFDCIVANPPYLTQAEWENAAPEVKDYEPKAALVAENEGAKDLQIILTQAKKYLQPEGFLALETGIAQHEMLKQYSMDTLGYGYYEGFKDLRGRDRFCVVSL